MIPSNATYQQLIKNYDQRQAKFFNSKAIQTEVDYFKRAVDKVENVDQVFRDGRLLKFLTNSLNLSGQEKFPGKLRQLLTQAVDNPDAAINKMSDKRFKQAAESLQFAETGLATLKSPAFQEKLIGSFKQSSFDRSIGDENPAVREALYFSQFAASTADNVWEVLSDPIVRKVVTKTLGIPERIAFQPLETQAAAIQGRLDISKLADKDFRDKFISRYLNQVDLENKSTNQGPQSWKTSLFSASRGVSLNLFA